MLNNIEAAGLYMLKPIDALDKDKILESPDKIPQDVITVGGPLVMNEVAVYMEDGDVLATVGTWPDSCIIITDLPRSKCVEIVAKGKSIFDRRTKQAIEDNE
jgi:hypothetical protein